MTLAKNNPHSEYMLRTEFHCHTIFSKDSLTRPANLVAACKRKGIDRVVVTDHNTIAGALRAKEIEPERVIIGEEIMTDQGELLAAYVREEIPPGLPPREAIVRLREQGAFISVSHPFDRMRGGHWTRDQLDEIKSLVDAIEVFNARCINPDFNRLAAGYSQENNLPGTVGSDAHTAYELGKASLLLPDYGDADGLRMVINQAQFDVSLSGAWVRLTSRYTVLYKQLFHPAPD